MAAAAAACTASGNEVAFSFEVIVAAGAEITTFLVLESSEILDGSVCFAVVLSF